MGRLASPGNGRLLTALLVLAFGAAPAHSETSRSGANRAAPGTCLSQDEIELARLVQEYRRAHSLPPAPLSKSLSLVAKWHTIDLEKNATANRKNERGEPCGLQSWSAKGPWTGFCYTPDHREAQKVWDKPKELTGGKYRGMGFESVYYNADGVIPFRALDYWKLHTAENDILLEAPPWSGTKWPAMGVAISGPYAALWFGTDDDPQGPILPCASPASSSTRPAPKK